jgi:Tfp pilus assembly protein PilX
VRARAREEDGIALAIAISVMAIVLLLVGVAVAYSVHSVNRSNRDRASARALSAAQAGIDVARWRMNKSIVASQYAGIISTNGLLNQVVATLGCTNLTVSGQTLVGGNWCAGSTEILDGSTTGGATNETYQYYTNLAANVDLQGTDLVGHLLSGIITRKIVAVGTSNGQNARLEGVLKVDLAHLLDSTSLLKLWTLGRVVQCPSTGFTPSNPEAGCPSL